MTALSVGDKVFSPWPDLAGRSDLPAHARIASWLEHLIVSRKLRPGDRLPSEVDIAAALGVSRMTLRQALASVESKGLLERRRGRLGGNFVSQPRFDFSLVGLPGFTEQMRRAHVEAGALVVQALTRAPSADVRRALKLRRGDQVHEVLRVRSANGDPITLEETYFPAAVFPGMLELELGDSLYQVMGREYGKAPHAADEVIEPVKATPQQAELLGIATDDSLLLITRTSYAADGVPVEFARDYFRPDRTRVVVRTQVDQGPRSQASPTSRRVEASSKDAGRQ
ncbi:MAG: GntR family transcriptional regulator [Nocardioides sp.]|nr:GntR family transcriptional regulator [Nocardioides sp.]